MDIGQSTDKDRLSYHYINWLDTQAECAKMIDCLRYQNLVSQSVDPILLEYDAAQSCTRWVSIGCIG